MAGADTKTPTDTAPHGPAVLIAGGGTGGHLYPGIAVARELLARGGGVTVSFVGTRNGIEARVLPKEGLALDLIRSAGLKGKSVGALARGVGLLPLSAIDAWRVLSRRRPDVVVGVGGYSSGPVLALAVLRGIPTLVLEQNARPGFTNRALAGVVTAAAVTYPQAVETFGSKAIVSGNPVREEFLAVPPADVDGGRPVRVLVFGGSQGAHGVNVAMGEAAPLLAQAGDRLEITHQTGERDLQEVRKAYARAGLAARVEPFLFEMAREMARADLVVCRSGATTLSELAAAGRPSVLVPLPTATDDHQRVNALALVEAGAARMLEQRTLTGAQLAGVLLELARDAAGRARMAEAARRLARPDAARVIADRVLALAG